MNNKINAFLLFLMLMPFCTYGYDVKWTLKLESNIYDVVFQYHDETRVLNAIFINGILISGGGEAFQNIITFANVIASAKEAGREIMPLSLRKNMRLPDMKGEEVTVFGKGKIKVKNYSKSKEFIILQIEDEDKNIITVTLKNRSIVRLATTKDNHKFLFERKDDFDKGEGGASFQVNHYFLDRPGDSFPFYGLQKLLFLQYESESYVMLF